MKTKIKLLGPLPVWIGALLCLCALCSQQTRLTGGGSDTEVTGRIITVDAKGNPGTQVSLIPDTYNPAFDGPLSQNMVCTTGADGAFRLEKIHAGLYNLFAINSTQGGGLLRREIKVETAPVVVPPDSLRKTATLVVPLPDSISKLSGYVYVPGTTLSRQTAAGADAVVFEAVPQCTIGTVEFKQSSADSAAVLFSNVAIDSASIIVLTPYAVWSHCAKIIINTSVGGAAVTGSVTHFPLLVRLSAANFDFSQTQAGGRDIRFSKATGRPLAFEIVKWDTALSQAVVWVSVDTVYGADASQYIRMHWGNNFATGASNPNAVFDTAYGFAAVWHLEEETGGVGLSAVYKDASPNAADGDDYLYSVEQNGVVANGHGFAGSDKITTNSGVAEMAAGDVTIAVWVNLAAAGGVIVSKGKENIVQNTGEKQLYLSDGTAGGANGLRPSFSGKGNGDAFADRDVPLDNRWHYLVFRWQYESGSAGTAAFFLDSAQTGITSTYNAAVKDNPNDKVSIGFNGIRYLSGYLDELHISKTARSSDWILLSYENQKPDQRTVTITAEK